MNMWQWSYCLPLPQSLSENERNIIIFITLQTEKVISNEDTPSAYTWITNVVKVTGKEEFCSGTFKQFNH